MVKIKKTLFFRIAFFATVLAFIVVMLGAYTRLKDAGLGCPDWPGCYGRLVVPETQTAIYSAHALYPNQPIEPGKAWAEMIHRYFAGTLGLLMLILAGWSIYRRKEYPSQPIRIPQLLVACLVFQALLGMWTVTWRLHPLVVMGHLLGGMTITSLLWWLTLDTGKLATPVHPNTMGRLRRWVIAGIIIVVFQIFLGGWTSANYASIICPDFPYCHGQLFPPFHFTEAFNFFSPIGQNYQGGILDANARVTIQMTHRYGAFITFSYLLLLGFTILFAKKTTVLKNTAGMMLIFLGSQVFLGILNIATQLYLPIALTHNAVALLLLLSLITMLYQLRAQKAPLTSVVTHQGEQVA